MKWRLVVYEKGKKAALECYDAGRLTRNHLRPWTDNYPYVDGEITMDGIEVGLCLKLNAMNAYGGLPFKNDEMWKVLPEHVAVHYLELDHEDRVRSRRSGRRDETRNFPTKMSIGDVKKRFPKIEMWVSDPRVLLLAYMVSTDSDSGLWKRLSSPIPSRAAAIATLKHYGLWKSFSPEMRVTERFYDLFIAFLDEMYCKFSPEKQEILKAIEEATSRMPLQEIKVAGVFAIKKKDYVLRALKAKLGTEKHCGIPVTLVREPQNEHDGNAIRVECDIEGNVYKLGYIPKDFAQKFAPMMDKGLFLNGMIAKNGIDGQEIKLKVTCRKGTGIFDRLSIVWGSIYDEWHEAEIVSASHTLIYHHRERYFSGKHTKIKLTFSPDQWESFVLPTLARCAFKEWSQAYRSMDHVYHAHPWRMVIQNGETEQRSYGCNRYPMEWHLWQSFIKASLDFNAPKGSAVINVKNVGHGRKTGENLAE